MQEVSRKPSGAEGSNARDFVRSGLISIDHAQLIVILFIACVACRSRRRQRQGRSWLLLDVQFRRQCGGYRHNHQQQQWAENLDAFVMGDVQAAARWSHCSVGYSSDSSSSSDDSS